MRNFMLVVRLIGYVLLLLPINEKAESVDPLLFPRWQENVCPCQEIGMLERNCMLLQQTLLFRCCLKHVHC